MLQTGQKSPDEQNVHFFSSVPLCLWFARWLPQVCLSLHSHVFLTLLLHSFSPADRCKEVQQIREQHPNKIPVSCSHCSVLALVLMTPLCCCWIAFTSQPQRLQSLAPQNQYRMLHKLPMPGACQLHSEQCKVQPFSYASHLP